MDLAELARDLVAEQESLDGIVSTLSDEQWQLATPSPGWTVADQIAHLTYFDEAAAVAITDPEAFYALVARLAEAAAEGSRGVDAATLGAYRSLPPAEVLKAWRHGRTLLATAAAGLDDGARVPWYGPAMGAKSFLTARLMETWAHGQDVVDTVAMVRPPTSRLKHVARLGYVTRGWSYVNRGLTPPDEDVTVLLTGPEGEPWQFGPEGAQESVTGPAEDFCLVVTQRRHIDDTRLVATHLAREWLLIAQAFAGPPTDGRQPGS
ncbi:MAG: TIGR03084 family metal-binding protein [Acidimicrobiia bacterium]|nr:TIGR03084 family metal-binding protein [Acidimicrobiia bacterium]